MFSDGSALIIFPPQAMLFPPSSHLCLLHSLQASLLALDHVDPKIHESCLFIIDIVLISLILVVVATRYYVRFILSKLSVQMIFS